MRAMDTSLIEDGVYYPDTDGEPMGDNEPQLAVIFRLVTGFKAFYAAESNVHPTGDVFWYPVRGDPTTVAAPDVMIIRGLGKQKIRSYRPWVHHGRVIFTAEVVSHRNTAADRRDKLAFYEAHGVGDHLVFDPQQARLTTYERRGDQLVEVADRPCTSPATGVTFSVEHGDLVAVDPTSRRWLDPEQEVLRAERERQRADALEAELERLRGLRGSD